MHNDVIMDVFELCYSFVEDVSKCTKQMDIQNLLGLLASERSERDTLRSVQLRIAYIYIYIYIIIVRANFVLITHKEGGA